MRLLANILCLLMFLLFSNTVFAAGDQFITIVNPVRGSDLFQLENSKPITNIQKQWEAIQKYNLSATWLIRPDGLEDQEILTLLKSFSGNQEIGIFMEVTPTWAKHAGVAYRENKNWHDAGSVFLTGYEVEERRKLIDTAFEEYKQIFGTYPKSVGAWWIDAGSLFYMREEYKVMANMNVADQYTTDNYQVWGQYWSTPFYPSRRNALVPALGEDQKIGLVTIQWATRDPFNGYGNGVFDSTYSVQANDYANDKYHNLDINYFKKLVSIYLDNPYASIRHVTVGIENDFSWDKFGAEYVRQLEVVSQRRNQGVNVLTMSKFAQNYFNLFSKTTPPQIIFANDPLGSGGSVMWYQNLRYRIGWFNKNNSSSIRDLRLYYEGRDEPCLEKRCDSLNLAMMETRNLDEVTFGDRWVIDDGKIKDIKITTVQNKVGLSYLNQNSLLRKIDFLSNDIVINDRSIPLSVAIIQAIDEYREKSKFEYNFNFALKDGLGNVILKQVKNLLIFFVFSILFFALPGQALLKKTPLDSNEKFYLSYGVGISFFTLFAFALGFLKIYWFLVTIPLVSIFFVRKDFVLPNIKFSKSNVAPSIVIIFGSISWLLTNVKNGLVYDYGMGFWGPHGHDAIWHLSLIESVKQGLPLQNSVFSSDVLRNYHYFYDLLLGASSKITNIGPVDLYFRMFPIIISLGVGIVSYFLAKSWFNSKLTGTLAAFFVYFGGSFGWILTWLKDRSFGGETTFWAQQSISTLINPPYAVSIWLFLAGLLLLHKFLQQKQHHIGLVFPLLFLWGTLIEFKVYAGLLVLGSLAIVSLVQIFNRNFFILKISIPIACLSLVVFLPNNSTSASLLVLSPFWLIHSMIDFPDRLNWVRLTNARLAGQEGNWFKLFAAETIGLGVFLLGNLGTRIIGLAYTIKFLNMSTMNLFVISFLALSIIPVLLFIQKGANFNTIQFFYYFLLMVNFLAAFSLSQLVEKNKIIGLMTSFLVIIFTIPTTLGTLNHYVPLRPPSRISLQELEALNFLKTLPNGVVLSYYYDKNLKIRYSEPVPLFAYESTPYVSAFSSKPEYIADIVNLDILGIDFKGRYQSQKDVFSMRESAVVSKTLKEGRIKYIYAPKIANIPFDEERFPIKRIFGNEEVEIYKVE